ncbi:very short patch repair endonuclease [Bradyrhizobium sp. SZCCHNR2035]|uniref:very short patch repair endonuclease n=1 Tax=Bradyrhizobium sp. SZCCHNR2035 TaxID=3057386 RepID=UPI0029170FC7|nr:very short patch repair endonuclease [Bradyrhizobium sp. SZCCHNR2035]
MDRISPEHRSEVMRRIKSKGTKPEMTVRGLVHGMGYRYRLHRPDLPGKPDLVFGPKRKVIFVHGCFWHGHERVGCAHVRHPKSNTAYWQPKLARNKERDVRHKRLLKQMGWKVLTVWECETIEELASVRRRIRAFLERA